MRVCRPVPGRAGPISPDTTHDRGVRDRRCEANGARHVSRPTSARYQAVAQRLGARGPITATACAGYWRPAASGSLRLSAPRQSGRPWDGGRRPVRPTCRPCVTALGSPSCHAPNRSSSRRRSPCSLSPRRAGLLRCWGFLAPHTLPRCAGPGASASPCTTTCPLEAWRCSPPKLVARSGFRGSVAVGRITAPPSPSSCPATGSPIETRRSQSGTPTAARGGQSRQRWVERARGPFPARWIWRRGFVGISNECSGSMARPATEQGTQGWLSDVSQIAI